MFNENWEPANFKQFGASTLDLSLMNLSCSKGLNKRTSLGLVVPLNPILLEKQQEPYQLHQ